MTQRTKRLAKSDLRTHIDPNIENPSFRGRCGGGGSKAGGEGDTHPGVGGKPIPMWGDTNLALPWCIADAAHIDVGALGVRSAYFRTV